jgi:hypothetical protein
MALPVTGNVDAEEVHDLENGTPRLPPVPFWGLSDPEPLPEGAAFGIDGLDYPIHPWLQLSLNGKPVPGKSWVECTPKIKLKANKTVGNDGGPTIEEGHEAARVEITISIWKQSQWTILQDLMRALWRRPGEPLPADPTKKAITVWSPAFSEFGITSILIESLDSLRPGPEAGVWIKKIRAVQYIAPKTSKNVTRKIQGEGGKLAKQFKDPKNSPTAISMPSQSEASAVPPTPGAEGTAGTP